MPILKEGSSGPDVKDLQQKLKDLGFDPNGVDGNFGPGTKAAVIAFQQSQGLQADGIAGPATLAAFHTATSRTPPAFQAAPSGAAPGGGAVSAAASTGSGATPAPPPGAPAATATAPGLN